MKAFLLTATSCNSKSLGNFLKTLKKTFENKQTNIIKIGRFVENKKVVSILKSPHVNKTAQEQFEKREKIVRITLISENAWKTVITIKKVLNKIFRDIKLNIKYLTNNSYNKINELRILKNKNFKLNNLNGVSVNKTLFTKKTIKYFYCKKKLKEIKIYFNIFNNYGKVL